MHPVASPIVAYANHAVGKRATIRVEVRTRLRDLSKEATSITINDDRVHVNAGVHIPGECRRFESCECLLSSSLAVAHVMTKICIRR